MKKMVVFMNYVQVVFFKDRLSIHTYSFVVSQYVLLRLSRIKVIVEFRPSVKPLGVELRGDKFFLCSIVQVKYK